MLRLPRFRCEPLKLVVGFSSFRSFVHSWSRLRPWSGLDENGRPIESKEARALKNPTIVRPSPEGAHNWHPISFNPATGLVYLAALDDPFLHVVDRRTALKLRDQTVGIDTRYAGPELAIHFRESLARFALRRDGFGVRPPGGSRRS